MSIPQNTPLFSEVFTARQWSCRRVMFSLMCVSVYSPPPSVPALHTASDICWSSLKTCSNLFIWGLPQKWHLWNTRGWLRNVRSVTEAHMVSMQEVRILLECFLVTTFFLHNFCITDNLSHTTCVGKKQQTYQTDRKHICHHFVGKVAVNVDWVQILFVSDIAFTLAFTRGYEARSEI